MGVEKIAMDMTRREEAGVRNIPREDMRVETKDITKSLCPGGKSVIDTIIFEKENKVWIKKIHNEGVRYGRRN